MKFKAKDIHKLLSKHPYYFKLGSESQFLCINSAMANFKRKGVNLFDIPTDQIHLDEYYTLSYEKIRKIEQLQDFTDEEIVLLVNIALGNVQARRTAKYKFSTALVSQDIVKEIIFRFKSKAQGGLRLTREQAEELVLVNNAYIQKGEISGDWFEIQESIKNVSLSLSPSYSFIETIVRNSRLTLQAIAFLVETVSYGISLELKPIISFIQSKIAESKLGLTVTASLINTIIINHTLKVYSRGFPQTYAEILDYKPSLSLVVGYKVT